MSKKLSTLFTDDPKLKFFGKNSTKITSVLWRMDEKYLVEAS